MNTPVSLLGVVLATASALPVGMAWYSPALFGKPWSKITGITDKDMKDRMSTAMPIIIGAALLTAYTLAHFMVYAHAYNGGSWVSAGVVTGFWAGVGLAGTAVFAHGAFEKRDKKVLVINAANRVVTLVIMGLILGLLAK